MFSPCFDFIRRDEFRESKAGGSEAGSRQRKLARVHFPTQRLEKWTKNSGISGIRETGRARSVRVREEHTTTRTRYTYFLSQICRLTQACLVGNIPQHATLGGG